MIPVYVKPYPDELMYSWINRLAKANGLSLRAFCNAYLGLKMRNDSLSYDPRFVFLPLFRRIPEMSDPLEMYLSVTTLAYESTRMSRSYLEKYVNNSFQPPGLLNPPIKYIVRRAFVCPECMAEDVAQYGEPYLHRAHHLNGVCVCHKHGVPLLKYHGTRRHLEHHYRKLPDNSLPMHREHTMDFDMDDYEEVTVNPPREAAVAYAKYANEILQAGVVTDSHKVNFIIWDQIKEKGLDNERFFSELKQWKYAGLFNSPDNPREKIFFRKAYNDIDIFLYLMFLFPDPADAVAALKDYGSDLGQYVCPDCGTVYCAASKNQWVCPKCASRMSDQELFKLQVAIAGEGEYVPLTAFHALNGNVTFLNVNTGEEGSIIARDFLYRGTRFGRTISVKYEWKWEHSFDAFVRYIVDKKTTYIPRDYQYEGLNIGLWLHEQRKLEARGKLLPYRREKLLSVVPELFSDRYIPKHSEYLKYKQNSDTAWNNMYASLVRYIELTGSLRVPVEETFEGHRLGYWVVNQRYYGRKGELLPERRDKLLRVDPEFFSRDTVLRRAHAENADKNKNWHDKCDLYEQYVQETGSPYVHIDTVYRNVHIGTWARTQRSLERKGRLFPERKARLLEIDPDFFSAEVIRKRAIENKDHQALDENWNKYCDAFEQYIKEANSSYIPNSKIYHGMYLGKWAAHQREFGKKGTLLPERRARLIGIDPDFFSEGIMLKRSIENRTYDAHTKKWHHNFDAYKQCVEEKGDLYIACNEIYNDVNIGGWVARQRKWYKKGTLPPEREQKILEIDPDFFNEKVLRERVAEHHRYYTRGKNNCFK